MASPGDPATQDGVSLAQPFVVVKEHSIW